MDILPTELLLTIVSYLDKSSVGSFRLVNKHLASVGRDTIFGSFEFHGNHHSIERMKHVLQDNSLARLVKVLVYNCRTGLRTRREGRAAVVRVFQEDDARLFVPVVKQFFEAGCLPKKLYINDLFYAKLDCLEIFDLEIIYETIAVLSISVEIIQGIELSAKIIYNWNAHAEEYRKRLSTGTFSMALSKLRNLTHLCLKLPKVYSRSGSAAPLSKFCQIMPLDTPWSSLRNLSLTNIDTNEDDFVTFMRSHAATLKFLHIETLRLYGKPVCDMIGMCKQLASVLALGSASFSGTLSDSVVRGVSETWSMDSEQQLGGALAHYLVHGGQCPLNYDNTLRRADEVIEV